MDTSKLRKFSQFARKALIEQVGTRMQSVLAEGSLARREKAAAVADLEEQIKEIGQDRVIETAAYTWFNRFCALRYMDVNRYTQIGVLSPAAGQFQPEILAEAKMGHIDDQMVPAATRQRVMRILDETDPSPDPQGEAYRLLLVAACNHYHELMPFMFEKIADYTELLLPDDLLSGTTIPAYTREALLPANCSPEHTDESVEVIGWLYQFYIADKKDDVFASLKKGKKITAENIPAATQLFTPHWIVRYLVENSLGRLWMLNHPESRLFQNMKDRGEDCYYIEPEEPETDFLQISSPEEVKVCDPACGSGHMLTYAFDLLYAIYEEQGYQATDIPRLILEKNLYGIEIDQRAGALAAFALTMKARENPRFLQPGKIVQPNVCVLENVCIEPEELDDYMDKVGRDLFTGGLQGVLNQFQEADNFGSLIRPVVSDVGEVLELLRERRMGEDLFLARVHQKVLKALKQADYLSPKHHVVVANPPYMGAKGMRKPLKDFAETNYPASKTDLFAMFTQRMSQLVFDHGFLGLMTPFTWMFIRSYERFRAWLLDEFSVRSLVRPEYHAFFDSAYVPICSFVGQKAGTGGRAKFIDLCDFYGEEEQPRRTLEAIVNRNCDWMYVADTREFRNVPGIPFAYQLTEAQLNVFRTCETLSTYADVKEGLNTGDNDRFFRHWAELSLRSIETDAFTSEEAQASESRWFPCNKGGAFRRWFGNNEVVIDWKNDGYAIRNFRNENGKLLSAVRNSQFYFREGLTWSGVGSSGFSVRHFNHGFVFNSVGRSLFPKKWHWYILGYLNSTVCGHFLRVLAPTLHFSVGDVANLPLAVPTESQVEQATSLVRRLVQLSRDDWNLREISRGFQQVRTTEHSDSLEVAIRGFRAECERRVSQSLNLERELNELYLNIFGLLGDVSGDVSENSVSLYRPTNGDEIAVLLSYAVGCMLGRYSLDKPGLILANQGDTFEDFLWNVSSKTERLDPERAIAEPKSVVLLDETPVRCFACGTECPASEMRFVIAAYDENQERLQGRPLIYCGPCADGNQAAYVSWQQPLSRFTVTQALERQWCEPKTLQVFLEMAGCFAHRVPADPAELQFLPDDDNVIPLLGAHWFTDDISERFKQFLKVTFGTEHYEENLTFLEDALYPDNLTGKRRKTIRDYFLKDFYSHHVKLYKKRPIYWLFSSPKGTFNALIYMHRYRPDTVSTVLQYLRDFRDKLSHHAEHQQMIADSGSSTAREKTKAIKDVAAIKKQLKELEDYERDTLFPLAAKQIPIDLDDGVKHNYPLFGKALKKVAGLSK